MTDLTTLLQQGSTSAWLFIPGAILLGALHGLEPGHSKTMMAAFIVAVRGTVAQAVLLGLSATLSHTVVVWLVALGGMTLFRGMDANAVEPYFQCASGVMMAALAVWMIVRTRREAEHAHEHHDHDHHHHDDHHHDHSHGPHESPAIELETGGYMDAHERQHAQDIRTRFADREVTMPQIVMFGITGGLIPCPGAITILLICLQLKKVALGALVVLSFSIGLALTMVTTGVIAAISVRQVTKRFSGFGDIVRKAPYGSALLIMAIGAYVAGHGWVGLAK